MISLYCIGGFCVCVKVGLLCDYSNGGGLGDSLFERGRVMVVKFIILEAIVVVVMIVKFLR